MFKLTRPAGLTLLLALVSALASPAAAQTAEQKFHHAYFLEREGGDISAAARLYAEVASDRAAPEAIRALARAHQAACAEEIASGDLTRLMPAETLAYAELSRPGDRLLKLLGQLGLLTDGQAAAADLSRRVAISPALVRELLGVRAVAVAITGFDPQENRPLGVAILHPGDIEIVRGLLETALPIGGRPVEPIGGFATFDIEGEVLVTLTSRLAIASPQRGEIQNVIDRLRGGGSPSLADDERVAGLLAGRHDSLLYFFVNARPIMPLVNGGLAMAGAEHRESALAQALLDLNSLEAVVGRAGVTDDGLFLDATLHLAQGHRNLVYNFARLPAIDRQALRSIPPGAAALASIALNERSAAPLHTPREAPADQPPPISALDLGRELFANIVGIALFTLPPDGAKDEANGFRVPDAAAIFTVRDPAKSEALWSQMLGIAAIATGAGPLEGTRKSIEGQPVRTFRFMDGITIHVAMVDDALIVSPSRSAMSRALAARAAGKSVVDDPVFARHISALDPHTTLVVMAGAARCAEIARTYAPPGAMSEAEPFLQLMRETAATLTLSQSANVMHVGLSVTGLPRVGPLVSRLLNGRAYVMDPPRVIDSPRHPGDDAPPAETRHALPR